MELWQLQQLQGLPLEVKIRKTQERIKEWYEHFGGQVYISFSGGKDSTVLLHTARELYPDIEAVFVDTGLEYPEIRSFVKTYDNVAWIRPKMNFKKVIEQYGYPVISKEVSKCVYYARRGSEWAEKKLNGTYNDFSARFVKYKNLVNAPFEMSSRCCDVMKKEPFYKYETLSKKKPIIGTTADESSQRLSGWLKTGCNSFEEKRPMSKPLSFWKEQDILHYLLQNNLPMASCYGEIIEGEQLEGQTVLDGCMSNLTTSKCKRTGCMFCMYGVHLEKEPNRFQMMRETHPKQYNYCINKLGLGKVLDYIGVKY